MNEPSEVLYQSWKKLYPRHQDGFFRTLRWQVTALTLGLWIILPLLRWNRGENLPDQAVLIDLPTRKFYLFGLTVWPQDVFLLAVLLIVAAVALFFITALAGRIFCGYLCFQTVWTDLFLWVEKVVEGDRKQRIKLDQGGWNGRKILLKVVKHLGWLTISLLTGAVFVFYFVDTPTLIKQFLNGSAPVAAWVTLFFITVGTYTMAGFAREQVCIYMCPYARFQGAMFDEDTLIVAYHPELGEPRLGNRRLREQKPAAVGACIDCKQCVTVCPTGIDIRDGQQYQCITCAACIDACDDVMARLRSDTRLIRYTSMREIGGEPTRFLRTRVLAYGAIMAVLLGGIVLHFVLRPPVDLTVLRQRQPLYILQSDGAIQNNYTLRVLNMSTEPRKFRLQLAGLDGAEVTMAAMDAEKGESQPVLTIGPGEVMPFTVYVRQSAKYLTPGQTELRFILEPLDKQGENIVYSSAFMRPS